MTDLVYLGDPPPYIVIPPTTVVPGSWHSVTASNSTNRSWTSFSRTPRRPTSATSGAHPSRLPCASRSGWFLASTPWSWTDDDAWVEVER